MNRKHYSSRVDQVAERIKDGIRKHEWRKTLPGRLKLAEQMDASHSTVEEALRQLTKEGWLVSSGAGKARKIATRTPTTNKSLCFRIILYEKSDLGQADIMHLTATLKDAGFIVDHAEKTLTDLRMNVQRVSRFVKQNPADAWIIIAASREINEWFSQQATPALAMFGRHGGLPMAAASPAITACVVQYVRRLLDLGHTRIVMFSRKERRTPKPARPEQAFLDELEAAGILTGTYNLPDWEESGPGLERILKELFRVSPPTALLFQETPMFNAARIFLAEREVIAPRDVSLVAAEPDPSFEWCTEPPAHFHWDYRPLVRSVVRWAKNIARGKEDLRNPIFEAEFIEGCTVGPAPKKH